MQVVRQSAAAAAKHAAASRRRHFVGKRRVAASAPISARMVACMVLGALALLFVRSAVLARRRAKENFRWELFLCAPNPATCHRARAVPQRLRRVI